MIIGFARPYLYFVNKCVNHNILSTNRDISKKKRVFLKYEILGNCLVCVSLESSLITRIGI